MIEEISGIKLIRPEIFKNYPKVYSCITTREGGDSFLEKELNFSLAIDDNYKNVLKNRKTIAKAIGIDPKKFTGCEQIHGINIEIINNSDTGKGALDYPDAISKTDGLITNLTEVPIFNVYADCTPILLFDPVTSTIGILHGGWKGTLNKIASKGVKIFVNEFNSALKDILVYIGPRIDVCCYEVSGSLIEKLKKLGLNNYPYIREDNHLNLGEINKKVLLDEGILEANIEVSSYCTSCRNDLFFSHRKEKGYAGRMAGIIMLKGENNVTY